MKGRPKCLNERDERLLLRVLKFYRKKYVNFSVKDLMVECGFDSTPVHQRTISRYLNRNGFYMRQARKKGLLNDKDKRLRLSYARQMKRVLHDHPDFYTNHVAFYLDAVSFVHKNDPRKAAVQPKSRVWRKGKVSRLLQKEVKHSQVADAFTFLQRLHGGRVSFSVRCMIK